MLCGGSAVDRSVRESPVAGTLRLVAAFSTDELSSAFFECCMASGPDATMLGIIGILLFTGPGKDAEMFTVVRAPFSALFAAELFSVEFSMLLAVLLESIIGAPAYWVIGIA